MNALQEIKTVVGRLRVTHPNATYELDWSTPEEMLVATTLAAQCTDERVNRVTSTLFQKYPSPQAFADADFDELAHDLKPTGFYKQKARSVQNICGALVNRFGGKVPQNMDDLVSIKGVARKTANVVLNCCFDLPTGIIVDTHVARVSQRMGLTENTRPEKIEFDLMDVIEKKDWTFFGPALVLHGRYTCKAKNPECHRCIYLDLCERRGVPGPAPQSSSALPMVLPEEEPLSTTAPKVDRWVDILAAEMDQPYFSSLLAFLDQERAEHTIFPPEDEVFSAFTSSSFDDVKVLILGQDPYHDHDQAHGLSFSVKKGVKIPPSLRNMYKELRSDLGIEPPNHGYLGEWAEQGVMMLNAVLTVRAHKPNSHKNKGWEIFTDAVIRKLSEERDHVVFLLWGNYAKKKKKLINTAKHTVIEGTHPSPLSARNGFFGSKPYSKINAALRKAGQEEIKWTLS